MADVRLIEKFGRYQKTVAAAVVGSVAWGYQVVTSAPEAITASEWLALASVGAVTLGVYGVPNVEPTVAPPAEAQP